MIRKGLRSTMISPESGSYQTGIQIYNRDSGESNRTHALAPRRLVQRNSECLESTSPLCAGGSTSSSSFKSTSKACISERRPYGLVEYKSKVVVISRNESNGTFSFQVVVTCFSCPTVTGMYALQPFRPMPRIGRSRATDLVAR
jgi:hypothetical protein